MTAIIVFILTLFGLYCIGVALYAYQQFDKATLDWEDSEEQRLEEELFIDTGSTFEEEAKPMDKFIIHKTLDAEGWDFVEYPIHTVKQKLKTGKDLTLEIDKSNNEAIDKTTDKAIDKAIDE